MPLRPYQESGIQAIKQAWREGHKAIIAVAPGGSGKSRLAVEMTRRAFESDNLITSPEKQFDVWFLAHRQELIDQPYRYYTAEGMRPGIVKSGVKPNPLARLQIASIKTVVNRVIVPTARKRALVFTDECHHELADEWMAVRQNLQKTYSEVFSVGLTATPYRADGKGLSDIATKLIEISSPRQLIAEGYIHNPRYCIDEESARLPDENRPRLVGNIVDHFRKHCHGYPGIGFAINVAHSKYIVEQLNAAGIRAAHVDGSTSKAERRLSMARLAIGGFASSHPMALDIVSNIDVFTEGFDADSCYSAICDLKSNPDLKLLWLGKSFPPEQNPLAVIADWARTHSMARYIQRLVRGCRIHPKKTGFWYLDHAGNVAGHCKLIQHEGFGLDEGTAKLKERVKVPVGSKFVSLTCPKCGINLDPSVTKCPDCGCANLIENKGAPVVEEAPGELVEAKEDLTPAPRKHLPHEQERWLRARLIWWAGENARRLGEGKPPYKFGMLWHQYKGLGLGDRLNPQVLDGELVRKVMREMGLASG